MPEGDVEQRWEKREHEALVHDHGQPVKKRVPAKRAAARKA